MREETNNSLQTLQRKNQEGLNHPLISAFSDLLPFVSSVNESFLKNTSSEVDSDVQFYQLPINSSY